MTECTICLDSLICSPTSRVSGNNDTNITHNDDPPVSAIGPCGHTFHQNCLREYNRVHNMIIAQQRYTSSNHQKRCPNCQGPVEFVIDKVFLDFHHGTLPQKEEMMIHSKSLLSVPSSNRSTSSNHTIRLVRMDDEMERIEKFTMDQMEKLQAISKTTLKELRHLNEDYKDQRDMQYTKLRQSLKYQKQAIVALIVCLFTITVVLLIMFSSLQMNIPSNATSATGKKLAHSSTTVLSPPTSWISSSSAYMKQILSRDVTKQIHHNNKYNMKGIFGRYILNRSSS